MKLGLLTAPFEDWSLEQVADWTAGAGMEMLEVACWPQVGGEKRRYAGTSHINVDGLTAEQGSEITGMLADKGIAISGLGYYPNPLHAEAEMREAAAEHLKKIISAAPHLGVSVVNTFMGGQRDLTLDQNWERAQEIFPDIILHAHNNGVTLCFENCPMIFSYDEWPGGHNIAYSPKIWRRIFEAWPNGVGMNFDPSHLIWQMIDIGRFLKEFTPKIHHAHAKDLEIDRDGLYENGVMSAGMGWQIPRLCGLGEVDWGVVFGALYRHGYDGPMIIEHEDRMFEGSDEKVTRGFLLARDVLQPFIK